MYIVQYVYLLFVSLQYAIQKLPLLARSYYPQTLDIREVVVEPPDERFYFITERTENIPHLKPQALTEVCVCVCVSVCLCVCVSVSVCEADDL